MTSTTVDALKALYVALGGNASAVADLNVIPDVINAIAGLGAIAGASAISVDEDNDLNIRSSGNIIIESTDTSADGSVKLKKGNTTINVGESGNIDIISNSELCIKSTDVMNIVAEDSEINIRASSDVDIESESAGMAIKASGGDLSLSGDEVTSNGKVILTEE